jgi:hypothetical protein
MKKLGEGWQYTAYDLGNGRVLKKFHPLWWRYWIIFRGIYPFTYDKPWDVPRFVKNSKQKAQASLEVLKRRNIPSEWIGNPKFIHKLDYEQDKAQPLHDLFENSDTDRMKLLIDQFITFNKQLWKAGIKDKSFNITKNYGLNKEGEMMLIDLGELFDEPVEMQRQLVLREYERNYVAGCIGDKGAREYFIKKMDENFGIK